MIYILILGDKADSVSKALTTIVSSLQSTFPASDIVLLGVLPRGQTIMREVISSVNSVLAATYPEVDREKHRVRFIGNPHLAF